MGSEGEDKINEIIGSVVKVKDAFLKIISSDMLDDFTLADVIALADGLKLFVYTGAVDDKMTSEEIIKRDKMTSKILYESLRLYESKSS